MTPGLVDISGNCVSSIDVTPAIIDAEFAVVIYNFVHFSSSLTNSPTGTVKAAPPGVNETVHAEVIALIIIHRVTDPKSTSSSAVVVVLYTKGHGLT